MSFIEILLTSLNRVSTGGGLKREVHTSTVRKKSSSQIKRGVELRPGQTYLTNLLSYTTFSVRL